MFKWLFTRLVDVLLVFLIVTGLLWYGAVHYPQFFPAQFFSYWQVAKPVSVTPTATNAVSGVTNDVVPNGTSKVQP